MRDITPFFLLLLGALFIGTPTAWAEDPEVLAEEKNLVEEMPAPAQAAARAWVDAWSTTPKLVTLQDGSESDTLKEQLENRLKQLGEKGFSNREWRTYWALQATDVKALVEGLGAEPAGRVAALKDWIELADKKVANQEVYFEAINFERDAVEDRLESLIEPSEDVKTEGDDPEQEEPNAYERLRMHKADLARRIESQKSKKKAVEAERLFIERQSDTEEKLAVALATDLELAKSELAISSGQASEADGWGRFWQIVATKAAHKVEKIGAEVEYSQVRQRARMVELGLGESQVEFRQRRIDELQAELKSVSGFVSLAKATWDTLYQWLISEAWKVFIGLLLIYFAVRFALRILGRTVTVILQRADDNPDEDDEGDQRRQTLADVFAGVARIGIYIVAGLVALEQIGVNTGPILGSVAILGLAISFGSQNLVRDVVNGFFILLENQYAVGDVVTLNGQTGTVEKISIRSTWIRQWTGQLHAVPNGSISLVSNHTRDWAVAYCDVGVGYGSDLGQVKTVIEGIADEMYADPEWADQFEDKPTWGGVVTLGDSAITVRLQGKVHAGKQWGMGREMNRRVKETLEKEGIDIPYPQQVVHHVNPA